MVRKKVNLTWIAKDSTRKATFKKRKKGLMKKTSELITLCGITGCAIVYGHNDPHPEVWPSVAGAVEAIERFKSLPEMEQSKKTTNQEGFLRQQIVKLKDRLRKDERENRELHLRVMMHEGLSGRGLHDVGIEDTAALAWMAERTMKTVQERIEQLKLQMTTQMAAQRPMAGSSMGVQGQSWMMNGQYMAFNGLQPPLAQQQQPRMIQQPQYYMDYNYSWGNDTFFPFK